MINFEKIEVIAFSSEILDLLVFCFSLFTYLIILYEVVYILLLGC